MSQTDLHRILLAIEPDPENRAALQRVLGPRVGAHLRIVASIDEALSAISQNAPDLILTSTFLTPADEVRLTGHLRGSAETRHTQVIALPQFAERTGAAPSSSLRSSARVLRFGRERPSLGGLRCDADEVLRQVEEYLSQARAHRRVPVDGQASGSPVHPDSVIRPSQAWQVDSGSTAFNSTLRADLHPATPFRLPADRRRASRSRAADLDGAWAVRLSDGAGTRLIDVSRLGVSLETNAKLTVGSDVHIEMLGDDRIIPATARLVRREISGVAGRFVIYRVAAEFASELDLILPVAAAQLPDGHPPKVLGDLLGRVLAGADWVSNGPWLRSRFEEELSGLVRVRAIRIGPAPRPAPVDGESLVFDIPHPSQRGFHMQAVFEPGYTPTPLELRLLRSAASLAAIVLELATPPDDHSPIT